MYKFRCELKGHTSDVRCIVNYDEDVIISGSRDRTCRVWIANNGNFEPGPILCGHTDFIASLCIVPASEIYPDGLIITGSNDHTICVFSPKSPEIQFKLISHTGTVCCVNPAINENYGLLSSSWDSTVIMWDLLTRSVVFKIPGYDTPVWSVIQMESGYIITASADKIIRSYTNKGELIKSFYGHSDCIRALYPVNKTEFISCGNDGHVLRWKTDSNKCDTAIDTVHHFLYCVSHSPSKNMTVYCGERGGIYVNSEITSEVISVPCATVWSATILPDGDIAAACNDGIVRIYTCDPNRYASSAKMSLYQSQVQRFASAEYQDRKRDLYHPYLNDLCGPEALNESGKISNQLCFVRHGFLAVMYSWSTDRWVELAKRKGTYQYDISKKKMYKGKAYDYLFPINIDDGKPNLILPLTLGDDILAKILLFMTENKLASSYSETIYNHIANTVKDDFMKASILEFNMLGVMRDVDYSDSINKYFPRSAYVCFEKANLKQILKKLKELVFKLKLDITDDKTKTLEKLTDPSYKCAQEEAELLLSLLDWPADLMLPVLDLLRLALRNDSFRKLVLTNFETVSKITSSLIYHLQNDEYPVNQLMALKVYCNMFHDEPGRAIIKDEFKKLISALSNLKFPSDFFVSFQVAASSLLLNLVIYAEKSPIMRIACLACTTTLLDKYSDKEAIYRTFVALGNLISYEGSFFIPKLMIETLKNLHRGNDLDGSEAHLCLGELLKCFQYED